MSGIRINDLVVGYAAEPVIRGLSLEIADGLLFTLLGPSGCGKTTLLRAIAGFAPVRSGRVFFGDHDVTELPAHQRDIGLVFQDYALFPDKTVFDNVAYGLRARKIGADAIKKAVGETLERVGLSSFPERLPAALSGGQRQRVALARALAIKPTVLLMDEPLSNLDAKLRHQVRETIADLQREVGITTVLVTHDQEEALAMSDQIGLLREGHIEQIGTPEALYSRPVSRYSADFVGAANALPVQLTAPVAADVIATFVLAGCTLQARAAVALPAGAAILIARPERLRLAAVGTPASPHTIVVTVQRKQYVGSHTRYRVELSEALTIWVQGLSDSVFAVGERAILCFDTAALCVVPA